jgi:hypothetical protein
MAIQKMTAVFPLMSKKLETAMPSPKKSVTGAKKTTTKKTAAAAPAKRGRGRPAGSKTRPTKTKAHKTAVAKSRANPMTISALSGFKSKGAHYDVMTKAKVGGRGRTKIGSVAGTKSGSGKKRASRAGVPSTAGNFLNADKTKRTRKTTKPAASAGGKSAADKRRETCAKKKAAGNPCGRPAGTGTKKPKTAAKNPKRTKAHKTAVAVSRAAPKTVSALSGFKSKGAHYDVMTRAKVGGRGRGKSGTTPKANTKTRRTTTKKK